jgi:ABC-type uncharacterized transport system substrate-binding protein
MNITMIGMITFPDEHGEWAAQTALRILDGEEPSSIPVVTNKRGVLMVNVGIADDLGIQLSPDTIKNAERIFQ